MFKIRRDSVLLVKQGITWLFITETSRVVTAQTVRWKKRNKLGNVFEWISEHSFKYSTTNQGLLYSLKIRNAEKQDQATYTCYAENCYGNTESVPMELVFQEKKLRKNIDSWMKARRNTIPQLKRLKSNMRTANERIRSSRRGRNLVSALSIGVGIGFTVITGGVGGLAVAAAVPALTTVVVFAIEKHIESSILNDTQLRINEDVEATLIFLSEVKLYISEAGYNKISKALRDIKLVAIDKISQDPLASFINSLVSTDNVCLLQAISKIATIEDELTGELQQVEGIDEQFREWL